MVNICGGKVGGSAPSIVNYGVTAVAGGVEFAVFVVGCCALDREGMVMAGRWQGRMMHCRGNPHCCRKMQPHLAD